MCVSHVGQKHEHDAKAKVVASLEEKKKKKKTMYTNELKLPPLGGNV